MIVEKTKLEGVLRLQLDCFEDHRGRYIETYNDKIYHENAIEIDFVQDDISVSSRHVLRGIHGDSETWKLISCFQGKFYLVVVNCDQASEEFGKWQSFVLSGDNRLQILAPPKHGIAHLVLTEQAIFHYKQSTYYNPEIQFTYVWNEPRFNIWWPVKNPILSQRDELGRYI